MTMVNMSASWIGRWKWPTERFSARRAASRAQGEYRGIALANYIETAGGDPHERTLRDIEVRSDGYVDVVIGTQNTGQGHETSFAQIVAEWLGVPMDRVKIKAGDTDFVPDREVALIQAGRCASLRIVIREATTVELTKKGRKLAAALFEVDPADIHFRDGFSAVSGTDPCLEPVRSCRKGNIGVADPGEPARCACRLLR